MGNGRQLEARNRMGSGAGAAEPVIEKQYRKFLRQLDANGTLNALFFAWKCGWHTTHKGHRGKEAFNDWWLDNGSMAFDEYLQRSTHHAFNYAWMAGKGLAYYPFDTPVSAGLTGYK